MILEFEQQKKEIQFLIENFNFRKDEYLKQFRSDLRDKIEALIPRRFNVKEEIKTKRIKADCTVCRKEYWSIDCKEEMGKCDLCRAKEYRSLLENDPFEINQKRSRKKKITKNVVPWHLGERKLLQIATYFSENYYIKRNFVFKKSAIEPIFQEFGVKLSEDEITAISNKHFLKRRGIICDFFL